MKTHIEHFLLTIDLGGMHMHGYVMSDDKRAVAAVINEMFDFAEKNKIRYLPIVLQTALGDGVETVREIICREGGPEPKKHWDKAKDFHCTIWLMPSSHPDDMRLMELH